MPKAKPVVKSAKSAIASSKIRGASHVTTGVGGASSCKEGSTLSSVASKTGGVLLEVDPNLSSKRAELANIVGQPPAASLKGDSPKLSREKEPVPPSPDFIDDPDVPPLI
jgi:hypothetical protein